MLFFSYHKIAVNRVPGFVFCRRGRTPAGRAVLETYLSYVPPLPALVLSQLSSGGKVYHFPTERPLLSENIVQWLQRIENNQEQAAGEQLLCCQANVGDKQTNFQRIYKNKTKVYCVF